MFEFLRGRVSTSGRSRRRGREAGRLGLEIVAIDSLRGASRCAVGAECGGFGSFPAAVDAGLSVFEGRFDDGGSFSLVGTAGSRRAHRSGFTACRRLED